MNRNGILPALSTLILFAACLGAQDTKFLPEGEQIPGPRPAPGSAATAATQLRIRSRLSRPGLKTSATGGKNVGSALVMMARNMIAQRFSGPSPVSSSRR